MRLSPTTALGAREARQATQLPQLGCRVLEGAQWELGRQKNWLGNRLWLMEEGAAAE